MLGIVCSEAILELLYLDLLKEVPEGPSVSWLQLDQYQTAGRDCFLVPGDGIGKMCYCPLVYYRVRIGAEHHVEAIEIFAFRENRQNISPYFLPEKLCERGYVRAREVEK